MPMGARADPDVGRASVPIVSAMRQASFVIAVRFCIPHLRSTSSSRAEIGHARPPPNARKRLKTMRTLLLDGSLSRVPETVGAAAGAAVGTRRAAWGFLAVECEAVMVLWGSVVALLASLAGLVEHRRGRKW